MIIFRNFDQIEGLYTACIGFFDGVHCGHRFLLERLKLEAAQRGLKSAVVTFANHPRRLVQPDFPIQCIDTLDERLQKLESCGVEACFLLDFTEDIRQLTAQQFICEILSQKMHICSLLIGYDHRFGHNRSEGFEAYVHYGQSCGMEVIQAPVLPADVGMEGHYSSSEVRRALASGEVRRAAHLLSCPFQLRGEVVHGQQLGRQLGFPTANIDPHDDDKLRPANGVYAAKATLPTGHVYAAMVNIGCRPTVDRQKKITFEAHLLGYEGDLYGQMLRLEFLDRIRDERKMPSLEALKEQLRHDCETTARIFQMLG